MDTSRTATHAPRIAIVMLGRKRGGIEQAAVDYCEALRAQGHSVVAVIRQGAAIAPDLARLGITTRTVRFTHPLNPLASRLLRRMLRDAECIIVHGNRAGALTKAITHAPVVAVAHSRFFNYHPYFASVIALSQPQAHRFILPCPVHVIPNLIRMPHQPPRATPHSPPVIGTLARLAPEKGIDVLLQAAAHLQTLGLPFTLRIGGEGALKFSLMHQAELLNLSVEWAGWVDDKTAFLHGLDFFALPSRTETFPITLLEAMAHGLPCIATRCGGAEAIIEHRTTGLLCDQDAPALAEALGLALRTPELSRSMATNAATYAAQHFAFEVVSKQLSELVTHYRNA